MTMQQNQINQKEEYLVSQMDGGSGDSGDSDDMEEYLTSQAGGDLQGEPDGVRKQVVLEESVV